MKEISHNDYIKLQEEFKTYWRIEKKRLMYWINDNEAHPDELEDINYMIRWGVDCFNEIKEDKINFFDLGYIFGKLNINFNHRLLYDFIEIGHIIFNTEAQEETKTAVTDRYLRMHKFTNFDKFLTQYNQLAKIELENTEELKDYFIDELVKKIENNGCINSVSYELKSYETKKEYTQTISVKFRQINHYVIDDDHIEYEFTY